MELRRIECRPAPADPLRMRLVGEVVYDDRPGAIEEYWYEIPRELEASIGWSGNPWLAALLPLAATLGEGLRIALPVDDVLLRGAPDLVAIWRSWYPRLHAVEVEAEAEAPRSAGSATGVFFSGGVDSFFTALRNRHEARGTLPIDDLISVRGLDIPLANPDALGRRTARLEGIARDLGLGLVEVATNLKETRLRTADWSWLWHGSGIVSAGLMLEGRYRRLMVASTFDYSKLVPLGSHPMTDPLLSTAATRVLHDGAGFDRADKVEYVSRYDVALRSLHVCWRRKDESNCGGCEKCLRTMLLLELSGRLGKAKTFPEGPVDLGKISRIFLGSAGVTAYYQRMRSLAKSSGRTDVVRAVDRCLQRSAWRRRLMRVAEVCSSRRFFWRAASSLRRLAQAGMIR